MSLCFVEIPGPDIILRGIWTAAQEVATQKKEKHMGQLGLGNSSYLYPHIYIAAAQREKIIKWISPINSFQRQADILSTLQPGTGEWFLANTMFKNWKDGAGEILWCRGIRGFILLSFVPQLIKAVK